jgi:hypothetical protein
LKAVVHLGELRRDPHVIAVLAHASFQDISHSERLSDMAQVLVLALELKCRRACDHLKARYFGEVVNHLLGQPVGKIFLVPTRAQVREGQNRDGCIVF